MKKIMVLCLKGILIVLLLSISYLNIALYYNPTFKTNKNKSYNESVYFQLNFLKRSLKKDGAGAKMQQLYPEGFIFIHALYALSWSDLIEPLTSLSEVHQEGIQEMTWALEQIHSPQGKAIFSPDLPLEYGAYYRGWSNYVLGSKLKNQLNHERDSIDIQLFKKNCNQIETALNESKSPYLESYKDEIWPADVVTAVASLKLYNEIFELIYSTTIEEWLAKVKIKLDKETGLIPHAVTPYGATLESARGSSQSLMLNFLKAIDPKWAEEQFELYKKQFLDTRFGLFGIREYPKGFDGQGDIDSGPVILEIGGAASIVGQRTMGRYGNWTIYQSLRNCIEGFGVSQTNGHEKQYIFGQLPMADAFIAWSNAIENRPNQVQTTSNWRATFQVLSFFWGILFLYGIFKF